MKVCWKHCRMRYCFFSRGQCLFAFRLMRSRAYQVGFPLSKLLFGSQASCFWQEQTIAKGISIERDKEFFHIRDRILGFPLIRTNKPAQGAVASQMKVKVAAALSNLPAPR